MAILKIYAEIADEARKLQKDYSLEYNVAIRQAKEMYKDQLEKAQSLATKQGKEHNKTFNDIISETEDLDNGEVYDINTRQTIREL